MPVAAPFPEIELHVHLEGTVRPPDRGGVRRGSGRARGGVPGGHLHPGRAGGAWAEVMNGFCDGAQEAEERTDVIVRLTPDIPRGCDIEPALETARLAVAFRHRGVDGLGLGGLEAQFPPEPYEPAFAIAKDGGLGSVPQLVKRRVRRPSAARSTR